MLIHATFKYKNINCCYSTLRRIPVIQHGWTPCIHIWWLRCGRNFSFYFSICVGCEFVFVPTLAACTNIYFSSWCLRLLQNTQLKKYTTVTAQVSLLNTYSEYGRNLQNGPVTLLIAFWQVQLFETVMVQCGWLQTGRMAPLTTSKYPLDPNRYWIWYLTDCRRI